MLLRTIISQLCGLRFLVERLELQSPQGKRFLLDSDMLNDLSKVRAELDLVEKVYCMLDNESEIEHISRLQTKLMQVRDIQGSVKNIKSNLILDDVELFEIKSFSLMTQEIVELQKSFGIEIITIPDLQGVISVLDPQQTRIPSFYIYDCYSEELAGIRDEIKVMKMKISDNTEDLSSQRKLERLSLLAQELEAQIRQELSSLLYKYQNLLSNALERVAHLDVVIAKALQAKKLKLCKPILSDGSTDYTGLFNPQIQYLLAQKNINYQPIDIRLDQSVCFITGANMAGKTVILKTLALCQYLLQFGFYVPATAAHMTLVDEVLYSIGDDQSEQSGLSSFASEMLKVNRMVEVAKQKRDVLILIDELARTTNPVEGRAIVNAVADILHENDVMSVITTHYSGLRSNCRKLRVKGLDKDIPQRLINKCNINDFMDYSLVEDKEGMIPHEALRIATMLGVNPDIIEKAAKQLDEAELVKQKILND